MHKILYSTIQIYRFATNGPTHQELSKKAQPYRHRNL